MGAVRSNSSVIARAQSKRSEFWAHRRFTDRLGHLCDKHGIELVTVQEFDSSLECPDCGTVEGTTRDRDRLRCRCGYEGHADLTIARTLLRREVRELPQPMAWTVRFQRDNHR